MKSVSRLVGQLVDQKPMCAIVTLVAATFFTAPPAFAEEGVNGANTAWILTVTALILFMTLPGLALLPGGLVHAKNLLSGDWAVELVR